MPDPAAWLVRLEQDGVLRRDGERARTTRRWQSAMARAAWRLQSTGDTGDDLRVPIAAALVDLYGDTVDSEGLIAAISVLLPIEVAELSPARVVRS